LDEEEEISLKKVEKKFEATFNFAKNNKQSKQNNKNQKKEKL
jgi:hypothetical protein